MRNLSVITGLIILLAFTSCEENLFNSEDAPTLKTDSVVVDESVYPYLEAYALMNHLNGRFTGVPKAFMSYFMHNETQFDEMQFPEIGRGNGHGEGPHGMNPYENISIEENPDGSYTATMDLSEMGHNGRGGMRESISGVVTETFRYTDSTFSSEVAFKDVSNELWVLNGTASYKGIAEGDSTDYTFRYKAERAFELNYSDTLYTWTSNSQESFSRESLVIETLSQSLSVDGAEYLDVSLTEALRTDMFCGRRGQKYFVEGSVMLEGNFGSLSLDYGNGDCNAVAVVNYNGETFEYSPQGFFGPGYDEACEGRREGNGSQNGGNGNHHGNGNGNGDRGNGNGRHGGNN